MATRNIYTDTGILPSDDSAATPSTVVVRDANGDAPLRRATVQRLILIGGVIGNTSTKTANYTATLDDLILLVDSTAGAITITLPAASTSTGHMLTVKKTVAANTVVIDGNASETIDGATTVTLSSHWAARTLSCNGTSWFVIASV
jgi:hypothetical protein